MQAEHRRQSRIWPPGANRRHTFNRNADLVGSPGCAVTAHKGKLNVMSEASEVAMTSVEDAAALWLKDRLVEYRELLAYLRDR